MAHMRPRGQRRALCTVAVVALMTITAACDDSGRSPVEDPTPSIEGTPPSDQDSYSVTDIDIETPPDAPATAADRVLRINGSYVLLGYDVSAKDGAIWIAPDLTDWDARGGWIAGYAGMQRIVGLVESNGQWIGAYNERPSGLPPLAWHVSTSDAGRHWHERVLPAAKSQPSMVTGLVASGGRVVAAGTLNEDESSRPVVWRTADGEEWTMLKLPTKGGASTAPRQPFRIGSRIAVPGAEVSYDGDSITTAKPVLWSSDDGGKTFRRTELPSIGDRSVPIFGLHTDAVDVLFGWSGSDAVAWRSKDEGRTWRRLPESTFAHASEGQSYPRRAVHVGGCLVLAGVIGDLTTEQPVPAALWRSCDAGKSWSRMATDELADANATDAVDLVRDEGSLVLVTNSGDNGAVRMLRLQQ